MITIQFGHSFIMNSVRQTRYAAQLEDETRDELELATWNFWTVVSRKNKF